jgi:hypothetical protein
MQPSGQRMPVAELVKVLLASDKQLVGLPRWVPGTRDHDQRQAWPVLVAGETSECVLMATCYPEESADRFTITLNYARRCIWRVDHELANRAPHHNPLDRVSLLDGAYEVQGPHFHSWSDNRYLAAVATLPIELPCARALPPQVRGWENAFRWFCGQTGIRQPTAFLLCRHVGGSCEMQIEYIKKLLNGCSRVLPTEDGGAAVWTHCQYPSNQAVTVFVYGGPNGLRVNDGGGAVDTLSMHGVELDHPDRFLTRFCRTKGLRADQGTIHTPTLPLEGLSSAVILVANASSAAAYWGSST